MSETKVQNRSSHNVTSSVFDKSRKKRNDKEEEEFLPVGQIILTV